MKYQIQLFNNGEWQNTAWGNDDQQKAEASLEKIASEMKSNNSEKNVARNVTKIKLVNPYGVILKEINIK